MPFEASGGSYGVGEVRRHSESDWSNLAPWRRMKMDEGAEVAFGGPDIAPNVALMATGEWCGGDACAVCCQENESPLRR